jgi:hypothetical protein
MREDEGEGTRPAHRWHMIAEVDLIRLIADHKAIERLCDQLEAIADTLPDRPAAKHAHALADRLDTILAPHTLHEDRLLATMFARDTPCLLTHSLLDHIRARHIACAVQAQDLAATFRAGSDDAPSPQTLGYMLRCFFEGCRDAIAFEQLTILALGGARLTPGARDLLLWRIAETSRTV